MTLRLRRKLQTTAPNHTKQRSFSSVANDVATTRRQGLGALVRRYLTAAGSGCLSVAVLIGAINVPESLAQTVRPHWKPGRPAGTATARDVRPTQSTGRVGYGGVGSNRAGQVSPKRSLDASLLTMESVHRTRGVAHRRAAPKVASAVQPMGSSPIRHSSAKSVLVTNSQRASGTNTKRGETTEVRRVAHLVESSRVPQRPKTSMRIQDARGLMLRGVEMPKLASPPITSRSTPQVVKHNLVLKQPGSKTAGDFSAPNAQQRWINQVGTEESHSDHSQQAPNPRGTLAMLPAEAGGKKSTDVDHSSTLLEKLRVPAIRVPSPSTPTTVAESAIGPPRDVLTDDLSAEKHLEISLQQPGSIQLVQFQEATEGMDADLFDLPSPSQPAADAEAPGPPPSEIFRVTPNAVEDAQASRTLQPSEPTTQLDLLPSPPEDELSGAMTTANTQSGTNSRSNRALEEFPKSGSEILSEIEDALGDNPTLPSLGDQRDDSPPKFDELFSNPLDQGVEPEASPSDRAADLMNGVDCRAAAGACNDQLAAIRKRELTNMSLDITPSIEPREFDMAKVDQVRMEKLVKAEARPWRDRQGNVIADGTLEDYRHGKVVVRTVNGTQRLVPDYKLSDADRCYVNALWELPAECNFEGEQFVMRDFRMATFTWTAAATCHKPLYFQEVAVERYGHTAGPILQPVISGAHFFGNVFMLPYHAGLTPPNECVYPLGYHRPGDCAPWIIRGFPMSTRGFKWQGLVLGAGIALLP